jgi:NADH-quinone oxidoreductase subunit J
MIVGSIFFAVCSVVTLVGALGTVLAKNPIRSAVGLLCTIIGIAGLFLKLNAQFLAAIQLIVYAGAVVVLFVFVIMLLGPDAAVGRSALPRARVSRWIGAVGLALGGLAALLLSGASIGKPTQFGPARPEYGSVEAVGGEIFTRGVIPFELATALLIVAVIGAIAVARSRHRKRHEKVSESPSERLFHGPLHPRDAGRPLEKEPAE